MIIEPIDGLPTNTNLRRYLWGLPPIDAVGLEQRVARWVKRSIAGTSQTWALDRIISLIDLTTLEGADTPGKIRSLVTKGCIPDHDDRSIPQVAAVCVYGDMVPYAVEARHRFRQNRFASESVLQIAAVATAFPSGRSSLAVKIADTRDAVAAGADEIDMVIDRGAFLSGRYDTVFEQIVAVKEACVRSDGSSAHLKVILETGELATYDNVRRASWLALCAGADFIKTSTGKISSAATHPVTLVMLEAVRDWRTLTGKKIGVKPAGGIRTTTDALRYLVMVAETVGEEWLTPALFRFGASSLLNDVLHHRRTLHTGKPTNTNDITID